MAYHYKNIDFDSMTDEEIDEFFRPKKQNSRKSLSPLFVFQILQNDSNPEKYLTQAQILKQLENHYEITLERKALSRILHNLEDEGLGVCYCPGQGYFYDPNDAWAA